jgi:hypothetical protein
MEIRNSWRPTAVPAPGHVSINDINRTVGGRRGFDRLERARSLFPCFTLFARRLLEVKNFSNRPTDQGSPT